MLKQSEAQALAAHGAEYRSLVVVDARRLREPRKWKTERGSLLEGQAGDWVLTDGMAEWTVSGKIFEASYREVRPGKWAKHETVHAVQLEKPVDVETLEGMAHAEAGDWLLVSNSGGAWPVGRDQFRVRYALIT